MDWINTISCNLSGESDIWLNLDRGLQRIFELHEAALMITSDYTVAAFKKFGENEVWLFDSHSRNEHGLADPRGTAVLVRFVNVNYLKAHIFNLYGVQDVAMTLTGIFLTDPANEIADQLDASIECDSLSSRFSECSLLTSLRARPSKTCQSGHVGKCSSSCSCGSCCSCNISTTSSERTFEQNLALGIRHSALSRRTYSSIVAGASVPEEHSYSIQPVSPIAASTPASSPGRGESPPMSPWHAAWPPLPPPRGSVTPTFELVEDSIPTQSPWSINVVSLSDTTSSDGSITIVSASDFQESFEFAHIDADADDGDETLDLSFLEEANLTCSDIDQDRKLATSSGGSLLIDCSFNVVTVRTFPSFKKNIFFVNFK